MAGQGDLEASGGFAAGEALARAGLFGEFQLHAPDGGAVALVNRRARALLAMLCLDPNQPIARDTLIRLLWPGRFEAQARASLRQCLLDLGKALEASDCAILSVARDRIGLMPGRLRTDLGDLEAALAAGDVEQVGAIVHRVGTRRLLDQMHLGDGFAEWLKARRDEIEHRIGAGIAETVDRLHRAGNAAAAGRLRDAWAVRETSHRPAFAAPLDGRTRVAVLPFRAAVAGSGDYFVDGIADELISTLGQVPQLMVTGRTSSFHFRDSDLTAPAIAQALQVSHLIEGSVQRQGEAVRVHVHLVDGQNGFELWGGRYDGTLDAIFRLQEEVAQAVTRALADALRLEMATPLVREMTHSKAAYDLYLQSRSLSFRLYGGFLETAIPLLEEAVTLDPDFAEAWLLKAEIHQLIAIYAMCFDRPAEALKMAACVERALAIKPDLGQAYSLLGLHQLVQNDFVGALDLAFKGYRMEPNNPQVAMRLGSYLMFCGRTEDGMKYIEEAIAQDPIDGRKFMLRCAGQLNRGNIAAAVADGQRSVDLGFPSVHLGVATAAAGEYELAVEHYMQTRLLVNKSIAPPAGTAPMTPEVMDAYWLVAAKGVCSGKAEDRETYCRTLDYLHMTMHDNGDYAITLPTVFMGYTEMLYKTLGERVSPNNMGCLISIWTEIDPMCRIWQDEEFIPFAQRIGMAAAWDKYGWPDLLPPPSNRA